MLAHHSKKENGLRVFDSIVPRWVFHPKTAEAVGQIKQLQKVLYSLHPLSDFISVEDQVGGTFSMHLIAYCIKLSVLQPCQ
jgi:hypothetical protein